MEWIVVSRSISRLLHRMCRVPRFEDGVGFTGYLLQRGVDVARLRLVFTHCV